MSSYNWVVGIILAVLGVWALLRLSRTTQDSPVPVAFYGRKEAKFVGVVVLPFSLVLSTALFVLTEEDWTLANVITVYGGSFGILATAYAIWRM